MMPPTPSMSTTSVCVPIARRENATTASKSSVRPSRRAATSGASGAANRNGAMRSISARRDRAAERGKQDAWIARAGFGRVEPADHRLERCDRSAGRAKMPDQAGSHERLADFGAGRRNEYGGHGTARQDPACARAQRAAPPPRPDARALKVRRRRAVPAGTVGGRIGDHEKPFVLQQPGRREGRLAHRR